MSELKITIGITAFNCGKYLHDAIRSVLDQNTDHWSGLLILDGGADKQSKQIFQEFDHPKFQKYAFKENQGPYGTRAMAIELSKTDWYYQLDGDDLLPKNAIKLILETIETNPDAEFVYGNCEHFSNNSFRIKTPIKDPGALCVGPLFNAQSPIKISLFERIGGFSDELFINADWDFWLSVYDNNITGAYTDNLLYRRRQRVNNVGTEYIHLRPKIVEKIIHRHPDFFLDDQRKNETRFNCYQKLARYYKSIGDRKSAAKYAQEALKYGDSIPAFDTIFREEKMSFLRYKLRRLGRFV